MKLAFAFIFVLGFISKSYSQVNQVSQYRPDFDTIRIQGYILAIGKQKFLGVWDSKGILHPTDSGYYNRQYFVPCGQQANSIGEFVNRYNPPDVGDLITGRDSSRFKSSDIFIFCLKGKDCEYFSNRELREVNKAFKQVLPNLFTDERYVRKEDSLEMRIFFIDGIWVKFTLPAKYGFDNNSFSWPIEPDMTKKECSYYYLSSYYCLSSDVDIQDDLLNKFYYKISSKTEMK